MRSLSSRDRWSLFGLLAACTQLALTVSLIVAGSSRPAQAAPSMGADVLLDQYIVVLQPGANSRFEANVAAEAHGVHVRHVYEHALQGYAFTGSAQAAEALVHNPNVKFVSPDRRVSAAGQTVPTGVTRVGANMNSTANIDGMDQRVPVNVAIIDTGIDSTHPDLQVVGGINCADDRGRTPAYLDGFGHGTHVAGTVGALDNDLGVVGVAPGAKLWAVRVLDDYGNGMWSDVICGIDWVTGTRTDTDSTNNIAVANLSLAGSGTSDGDCGLSNADALHQALCRSVSAGVVYVVAAGNSATNAWSTVPAAYGEGLTVSALADSDGAAGSQGAPASPCGGFPSCPDDTLAPFSNWGPAVDIAAPGVNVLSTCISWPWASPKYCTMSGTSMAAPHVAGAVALYVARYGPATSAAGVATIRASLTNPTQGFSVPQYDRLGFTGDRDANPEPLLYLASTSASSTVTPTATALTATPPTSSPSTTVVPVTSTTATATPTATPAARRGSGSSKPPGRK